MNLKNMIEHLQETGKVLYREGNLREAIKELDRMGYEVHFYPPTDYLFIDKKTKNGIH